MEPYAVAFEVIVSPKSIVARSDRFSQDVKQDALKLMHKLYLQLLFLLVCEPSLLCFIRSKIKCFTQLPL